MNAEKHIVTAENAEKIFNWLEHRGGIYIWRSVNLSNPGASWTTPATTEDGKPYPKPTWQADSTPERHVTDPNDVVVSVDEVVKRFHIATRMGGNRLTIKVTDGGTRRIRREVAKAGEGAYYEFDYSCQDCLIFKPVKQQPLLEWLKENKS